MIRLAYEEKVAMADEFLQWYGSKIYPNIQDQDGKPALHYAVENDRSDIVGSLKKKFEARLRTDIRDRSARTPIDYTNDGKMLSLLR